MNPNKILIQEVPENSGSVYQLWAEFVPVLRPEGYQMLQFSSTWSGAKNPDIAYSKGQFLLSPEGLANLQQFLSNKVSV